MITQASAVGIAGTGLDFFLSGFGSGGAIAASGVPSANLFGHVLRQAIPWILTLLPLKPVNSWDWDKGRAPTARAKAAEVKRLLAEGVSATETAKRLAIGAGPCTEFWRTTVLSRLTNGLSGTL